MKSDLLAAALIFLVSIFYLNCLASLIRSNRPSIWTVRRFLRGNSEMSPFVLCESVARSKAVPY